MHYAGRLEHIAHTCNCFWKCLWTCSNIQIGVLSGSLPLDSGSGWTNMFWYRTILQPQSLLNYMFIFLLKIMCLQSLADTGCSCISVLTKWTVEVIANFKLAFTLKFNCVAGLEWIKTGFLRVSGAYIYRRRHWHPSMQCICVFISWLSSICSCMYFTKYAVVFPFRVNIIQKYGFLWTSELTLFLSLKSWFIHDNLITQSNEWSYADGKFLWTSETQFDVKTKYIK